MIAGRQQGAGPVQDGQGFRVCQAMIPTDFKDHFGGKTAGSDEFFGIREGDHCVLSAVQDEGTGFQGSMAAVVSPCRAQQDQRCVGGIEMERNGSPSGTSDNDVRRLRIIDGLRGAYGG